MSKCINCGYSLDVINVTLETKDGNYTYCPNCLIIMAQNGFPFELIGNEICDITGEIDAVKYVSEGETYCLSKESLLRLINRNLTPNEYLMLTEKYSDKNFMLHDDFYDEDGIALQPVD